MNKNVFFQRKKRIIPFVVFIVAKLVIILMSSILIMGCTTLKTPEMKGVVLDTETGKPIMDARIYTKWERKMIGFGGETSGGIEKELRLKTKDDGAFLIPGRTFINFIPFPIGRGGFFYMIVYAHGYKFKSFTFYEEKAFGHPRHYEEFKKLGENRVLLFKLEEIKDPETYDKNRYDFNGEYSFNTHYKESKEDSIYDLVDYQTFVDRFPTHKKIPGYRLAIGTIYEGMKDKGKAKLEYEKIIKDFPDSSGAKEARNRLAKLGVTR
jgi:hypothetical protein